MGKVKPQPESLKPSIQHNVSISKNEKRKEKRLSKSLTMQKAELDDFIPVKKASLLPLNKIKNEAKQNGFSSSKGKKENAQLLSKSLPIKSNKKEKNPNIGNSSFISFLPKGKKPVTGILSNRNTPKKNKSDRVTFKDEPVRPASFQKDKKAVTRHAEESSDDDSDDDTVYYSKDLRDNEASDGEETDDDSGSEVSDDGEDVSDEDESDENTNTNMNISNFDLGDEDESDDDDEDDDEDENDEDEGESDSEDEPVQQNKTPKKNDSILKLTQKASTPKLKEMKQNTPLKTSSKLEKGAKQETPLQVKAKLDKSAQETPLKTSVTKDQLQKENKNSAKKAKLEAALGETKQEKKKPEVKSNIKDESSNKSDNVGFIRNVPEKISEAEIKAIIGKKCGPDNVVNVVLNKRKGTTLRNAYVHMKNVKLLESILNHKFTIGDFSFPIYKAKKESIIKPVAFLPRVPVWASNDLIKQAIDDGIGAGSVTNLEVKKEDTKTQTKNVLIYFSTMDAMKEAIFQGEYKVKETSVIVREAKEAGINIPVHRAVITDIPDKTTEALLTKTLEAKIGADTIHNIRFSFRKNSFAFVVFKTEEAQKKALELADTLSLKNTKIKIIAYVPRTSTKRAPANEHTKQKRAEKRKNQKSAIAATGDNEEAQPLSPKKMKREESSSNSPNNKSKKIKNKSIIASTAGAVKAKKNPVMKGKKKFTQKKESVKQDKVSPVKEHFKGKRENTKNQIKQKKQKAKKAE